MLTPDSRFCLPFYLHAGKEILPSAGIEKSQIVNYVGTLLPLCGSASVDDDVSYTLGSCQNVSLTAALYNVLRVCQHPLKYMNHVREICHRFLHQQ